MIDQNNPTETATSQNAVANQEKPDWFVASLKQMLPESLEGMAQTGLKPDDYLFENPDFYWNSDKVKKYFNNNKPVFDEFYNENKKLRDLYLNTSRNKSNGDFIEFGAQNLMAKEGNIPSAFSMFSRKSGLVDPWGRNEAFGEFTEKKWGLLEAASDNGVRLKSGQRVSIDDYQGQTKAAKDENGAFLFDDEGKPYFVPVEDGEELRTWDVVYNPLAKKMGYYGHDYGLGEFMGTIVKAPVNFISGTLESLVEIPKVLVQTTDPDSDFVKRINNFQTDMKGWNMPTTESGQESLWTFENGLNTITDVMQQLAAMYVTGGLAGAVTQSARIGSMSAKAFMMGISLGPVSQVAKDHNLSAQEAAIMMVASAPFLYWAQGLSDKIVRGIDPTKYDQGLIKILEDSLKVVHKEGLNQSTFRSVISNAHAKVENMILGLSKAPAVVQGAALEGMEEGVEQVVDLASRLGYNLVEEQSLIGGKTKKGYNIDFVDELNQVAFAGATGAGGGAMGKLLIQKFDKLGGDHKDIPDLQRGLIDVFANGQGQRLYKMLDKMKKGKTNVTLASPWLNMNGEPTTGNEKSQNTVSIEAIETMARYVEEVVNKSGMQEAIRNNNAMAGELREVMKTSNVGADYARLVDAKEKIEGLLEGSDKTATEVDRAKWKEELELINKDLIEIRSGKNLTKYLEEGMYNMLDIKAGRKSQITGKDFHNLNKGRKEILASVQQEVADFNTALGERDLSVSLADFQDDSKPFTQAGKQKLFGEFEAYIAPRVQQVAQNAQLLAELGNEEGLTFDPNDLSSADYLTAMETIRKISNEILPLVEQADPALAQVMKEISTGDFDLIESLQQKEIADPKKQPTELNSYLTMVDPINIGKERVLIPHSISIEDKLFAEEKREKDGAVDGVSAYTAGEGLNPIKLSIISRINQIQFLNEVAVAINPKKLKVGEEQIQLLSEADKQNLLDQLSDMYRRVSRLEHISAQNMANSDILIAKAMSRSLHANLDRIRYIKKAFAKSPHSYIADLIDKYDLDLDKAASSADIDGYLHQMVDMEHQIHEYGKSHDIGVLLDVVLDPIRNEKGELPADYTAHYSVEVQQNIRAYDLMRGILSYSTADAFNNMRTAVSKFSPEMHNPTVQQMLTSVRAVQNMLAGDYAYPVHGSDYAIGNYTSAIDSDPGAGKTEVMASLVVGTMQEITKGKTYLAAHPDNAENERRNNLVRAVTGAFKEANGTKVNVNLSGFTGNIEEFLNSESLQDVSLIVYDEATLLSDEQLKRIFAKLNAINKDRMDLNTSTGSKYSPVHFLMLGDTFQKTATNNVNDTTQRNVAGISNSHKFVFPRTDRVDYSFRIQNQALKAVNDFFKDIQSINFKITPPLFEFEGKKGVNIFNSKPEFYQYVEGMLKEAASNGSIQDYVYITPDKSIVPSGIRDTLVRIMTPEEVQGKERPYVIVDFPDTTVFADGHYNLPLKQDYYTAFTRAKNGVVTYFPSDQGFFSRSGRVYDVQPLKPTAQDRATLLARLDNILGDLASRASTSFQAKPYRVAQQDKLIPEVEEDEDEQKPEEKKPVQQQQEKKELDPEQEKEAEQERIAQEVAQIILTKNVENSITAYSYVTPVTTQSDLKQELDLKRQFLYNKEFADKATYQLVVAKIGSKRMSQIPNVYGQTSGVENAYGVFIEGVSDGKATVLASMDAKTMSPITSRMQPGEELIIPLSKNPFNYTSQRYPYLENTKVKSSRKTLGQIKKMAHPGVAFSDVLICSESVELANGGKLQSSKRYVAVSFKHSNAEDLNAFIRNGKFNDPDIRYIELDGRTDVAFENAFTLLEGQMDDAQDNKFSADGFVYANTIWMYLGNDAHVEQKKAILDELKQNNAADSEFTKFLNTYITNNFSYLVHRYVGFRLREKSGKLNEYEERTKNNLDKFFNELKKLPYFTNGFHFDARLLRGSTKQNPVLAFAPVFNELGENSSIPFNSPLYDNELTEEIGMVTLPQLQINKAEFASMLQQAKLHQGPSNQQPVQETEIPYDSGESALGTKTEKVDAENMMNVKKGMTEHEFFALFFKQFDENWFSESKRKFKRLIHDKIFLLEGDQPKMNNVHEAVTTALAELQAVPVKIQDFKDPKKIDKNAYITGILTNHFDWYLSQYFPAVKLDLKTNTYGFAVTHLKQKENFDKENYNLLKEGITDMVWTMLQNTPLLKYEAGQYKETGEFLGPHNVEELIKVFRGSYYMNDYERLLSNADSPVLQSFYNRFLNPNPYNVDGKVRHSFRTFLDNEDGFAIHTAIMSSIGSGEIFKMSTIDLKNKRNKIPGSSTPTIIKQRIIDGVARQIQQGNVHYTKQSVKVGNTSHSAVIVKIKDKNFPQRPSQEEYEDNEVIDAMTSIGFPFFNEDLLAKLIEGQVFDLNLKKTHTAKQTKQVIMDKIFFRLAAMNKNTDFNTIPNVRINQLAKVIEDEYKVNSNLTSINTKGDKVNVLRKTASIFNLEALKALKDHPDRILLQKNMIVNEFYRVSSDDTALFDGIRLNNYKSKSNTELTAGELLHADLIWNFRNQLEAGKNNVLMRFTAFSDSSSDLSHIITASKGNLLQNPRTISNALFESRMDYHTVLEQQILSRWNKVLETGFTNINDLDTHLNLKANVSVEKIKIKGLYENLDYVSLDGKAVIKKGLINDINFYKNAGNEKTFFDNLSAEVTDLTAYLKTQFTNEKTPDGKGFKSVYDLLLDHPTEKGGKPTYSPQTVINAFYFNWVAFSTEMDNIFSGPLQQYKSKATAQDPQTEEVIDNKKRIRGSTTNGTKMIFADPSWAPKPGMSPREIMEGMRVSRKIPIAVTDDINVPVRDYSGKISMDDKGTLNQDVYDGSTFVNPALRVAMYYSYGGKYNAAVTPIMKNITNDVSTGMKRMIKNADAEITIKKLKVGTDLYRDRYRKMLMMRFPKGTMIDGKPVENALQVLANMNVDLQNFSNLTPEIIHDHYKTLVVNGLKDYMIMEIVPKTSLKTGATNINQIDGTEYVPTMLDVGDRLNILDASKDPTKGMTVTFASQIANALGINRTMPVHYKRMLSALGMIADEYVDNLASKDPTEVQHFFRQILRDSVEGRSDFTYQTKAILSTDQFSIQDRQVIGKLISGLNSNISNNAIAIKMQGGQFIVQAQRGIFQLYNTPTGVKLRDQLLPEEQALPGRDLRYEDPFRKSDEKYLSQLYDAILDLPVEQREQARLELHQSLANTADWVPGFCEIVAPADMLQEFHLQAAMEANLPIDAINLDYFKQVIAGQNPESTPAQISAQATEMFNSFRKRLDGMHIRIPTTGKHSAVRTRIVAFMNDSMNASYVPPEYLFIQGADLDIDKGNYLTFQNYKGRTPILNEALQFTSVDQLFYNKLDETQKQIFRTIATKNRIVQDMMAMVESIENLEERSTPVKIVMDPWAREAKRREERGMGTGKTSFRRDSFVSYVKMHQILQAGKAMVGIFANGQKAYQVLYEYLNNGNYPSPFAGLKGINQVWFKFSGLINAATDNAKEQLLGRLGISMSNGYLVNYLVATGYSESQVVDFLDKYAAPLAQKEHAERFDSEFGFNVEDWRKFPDLYKIHHNAREFDMLATTILNREIPNGMMDMYNFRSKIENHVNQTMVNGKQEKMKNFNFVQFLRGFSRDSTPQEKEYSQTWINAYDQALTEGYNSFNLLRVYAEVPHLRSYLNAYGFVYKLIQDNSSIFKTTEDVMYALSTNRDLIKHYEAIEDMVDDQDEEADSKLDIHRLNFKQANDFVYGYVTDAYFKYKGGLKDTMGYDLSIPTGRKEFVNSFHLEFELLQKEYRKNAFFKAASISGENPMIRLPDIQFMGSDKVLEIQNAFSKLPDDIKQRFVNYSLITSRDKPGKGAINQVFEPEDKSDYIDFLNRITQKNLMETDSPAGVTKLLHDLKLYSDDPYNNFISYESNFNGVPAIEQKPVVKQPKVKKPVQEEKEEVLEMTDKPNTKQGTMYFPFSGKQRPEVQATTTFDAILNGERTATTRYPEDGKYWDDTKVGDRITWWSGKHVGEGKSVDVRVTKVTPVDFKAMGDADLEEWSRAEGWSVDYAQEKVNKANRTKGMQIHYERIDTPTPVQKSNVGEQQVQFSNRPKIKFNTEQQDAIQRTVNFIKTGNPKEFYIVEGKAGTGKTTIAEQIISQFPEKRTFVAALSNQAVKVIHNKFGEAQIEAEFGSIAKLLGISMDIETGKFVRPTYNPLPVPIESMDIILVDEASMVNEEILEEIFYLKPPHAKVIFLGDIGQLPPIRTTENPYYENKTHLFGKKSPVFSGMNKSQLQERVRQGEESPILPYADMFWENSQVANAQVNPAKDRANKITSKGALLFNNNFKEIKENVISAFKKSVETGNPEYIKIVTYRNPTRQALNKNLHTALFGENAPEFNKGELIIFTEPWGDEFDNSEQSQVISVSGIREKFGIKYVELDVKVDRKIATIPVVPREEIANYNKVLNTLSTQAKQIKASGGNAREAWAKFWNVRNYFAKIDYAYAITSHKSQGSTYDIVVVDEADIMDVKPTTIKNKSESIYTGITRARNITVVVSAVKIADPSKNDLDALNGNINSHKGLNQDKPSQKVETEQQMAQEQPEKSLHDPSAYTNHSGGAVGADSSWDTLGKKYGIIRHNHYYHGQKTPLGNIEITAEQLEEGWQRVLQANGTLKRKPQNYKDLLSRNWMQVKNADQIFAVAPLDVKTNIVDGGTGWAVQMAIDAKKPVSVFDLNSNTWYSYNFQNSVFEPSQTPTLTKNFAGIGTRKLTTEGINAIEAVYQKTFSNKTKSKPLRASQFGIAPQNIALISKVITLQGDYDLMGIHRSLLAEKELSYLDDLDMGNFYKSIHTILEENMNNPALSLPEQNTVKEIVTKINNKLGDTTKEEVEDRKKICFVPF